MPAPLPSAETERMMKRFFQWLSEKDRRRCAAVEAAKLGHGGVEYVARVLAFSVVYDWRLNGDATPLSERMLGRLPTDLGARRPFACRYFSRSETERSAMRASQP